MAAFSSSHLVVIDDEPGFRESLAEALSLAGFSVRAFPAVAPALAAIEQGPPAVVLSDLRMGGLDGMALLERCRTLAPHLPVVLMTGHADVPTAVQAIKNGAYDFVEKPFEYGRLLALLQRAIEQHRLLAEDREMRERVTGGTGVGDALIGESPAIQSLRDAIRRIAPTAADVLVFGETGTGKELVARALHEASGRKGNFVAINCAAIPEQLFESELFGFEAGAFTGAGKQRVGKIEHARDGTLFLDEIDSLPLPAQAKLLRVLQERVVERLGGNRQVTLDFRVVAATNRTLPALVQSGKLRPDLYYRLNVLALEVPPLRERLEDVPLLFNHFLDLAAAKFQVPVEPLSPELRELLLLHPWPGNVRELKSAAERVALGFPPCACTSGKGVLTSTADPTRCDTRPQSLEATLASIERMLLSDALRRHQGAVSAVCEELQITTATCYRRLKEHALDPNGYRA